MKLLNIELRSDEMIRATAGSLHMINRPVEMPEDLNPEHTENCQFVRVEGSNEWVLVTSDGCPITSIQCPYGSDREDVWFWVREEFITAADSDRIIFKSDLPEDARQGVAWKSSRDMSKSSSRFSLRIHDIKVVYSHDPELGLVPCWSMGVHTYLCGIKDIPVVNKADFELGLSAS